MRIVIAAVGRARNAAEDDLTDRFLKNANALGRRLGFRGIELATVNTSRAQQKSKRIAEEADRLIAKIPRGARIVALDANGRALSSEDFARTLARMRDDASPLAFVIGGPDGLSASIRDKADLVLAFGPQSWPHMLARAMLAEQIYRAFTILGGHPYHTGH
ncbi:MAG: 23S rRNA (pseudouridine(1915)-N(3))-methyltransferase RlmH [Alphaproteobacteria bacterium]